MIKFNVLKDEDPALAHSPLLRGITGVSAYVKEHGGIGLTKAGAFNRKFVHWAAANLDWPGYGAAELFELNKVLNEPDFPPLVDVHEVLVALRFGSHRKGEFVLTSTWQTFADHPGQLFLITAPFYLLEVDHAHWGRTDEYLVGNWDDWLNVINVEAHEETSGLALRTALYGHAIPGTTTDAVMSDLYVQVLRPLCWAGLLKEGADRKISIADRVFSKTPLWKASLQLRTDGLTTGGPRQPPSQPRMT